MVDVVASTSVYGDIVSSIGGDKVRVSSIINRTSQDPHSYEATTQDKLAVSKAELVVENGGGYDAFIDTLADRHRAGPRQRHQRRGRLRPGPEEPGSGDPRLRRPHPRAHAG